MCALDKECGKDRDDKMNTTIEKMQTDQQQTLKGGSLGEAAIECKPRGCTSRGNLY